MSGAQIGGAIGAVIGAYFGMPQVGYAIGSAIGGYIDPTQVKGPRLSDAMSQTSSVGIPLPFGYGRFTTAGNLIWRDPTLKEIAKRSRGKGGGTKTTTYSYTRSYAIGVCEGPIYGFLHIKRNGKLVYSSDPDATIEDKKYSAKWLQKAKLYYGVETQMPDSTITAVEGAGNVSPFRGLAYIAVENDDLTDLQGAIPQYEFCVRASPPEAYLTSKPYAQITEDANTNNLVLGAGRLQTVVWLKDMQPDGTNNAVAISAGRLRSVYQEAVVDSDSNENEISVSGGKLSTVLKSGIAASEGATSTLAVVSGKLKLVPRGLVASEGAKNTLAVAGGKLTTI